MIEPPLYPARPHGAPGVNSYILDTIPSDTTCAAGFRRIEIEPFIGSACNIVGVNGFQTAPGADLAIVKTDSPDTPTVNTPTFADGATTQLWPTPGVQGCLPDVYPNWAGPLVNVNSTAPVAGSIQLCYTAEPLAVTLADFGAVQLDGRVQVSWETTSELNNAGFNLYRNTTPDPVGDLLAYVPSQAPGSTQGYVYSYDDADVQPGHTYWYWLEDVSLSGATTLHGPVSVTFNAPTAVGLAGFDAVRSGNRSIAGLALAVGLAVVAGGWTVRRRSRRLLR